MENRQAFLKELHDLLDKYKIEITIGLDGDTHCLESWMDIQHRPDPKAWKYIHVLTIDQELSANELKQHIAENNDELKT